MIHRISKRMTRLDEDLCRSISSWNGNAFADRAMRFFTRLGDGPIYPAVVLLVLVLDAGSAIRLLPAMAIAFAFELSVQKALKHGFRRLRPCLVVPGVTNLVSFPDAFSFPSGHTAGAFLAAVQISALYPGIAAPLFAIAGLVGFSRVYNGVHYPGDVAVGALLGAGSGFLGLALI